MTTNKPVTAEELTIYGRAKERLAKLVGVLKTKRASAARVGNAAAVRAIDYKLKEAADLQNKAATLDKIMAPFLSGWDWVKARVGLDGMGELGAFFVPVLAAGGIGAFVYAVKQWGDNTETLAEQIDAQNRAAEAAILRGEDPAAVRQQLARQSSEYNTKPPAAPGGLLEKLVGSKTILMIVAAVLAYYLWTRKRGQA